ncbi:hypothetical protein VSR82_37325 [Burkholderia sp. JPY481]|uniref:hypothetical protein n=1 Tax=unclassified Paraburkholderia TaxID=2615204 RepID=UPI00316CBEC4
MRVLGTVFPWQLIISASSPLAVGGAAIVGVLDDGPHSVVSSGSAGMMDTPAASPPSVLGAFRIGGFWAATLGYFGHMRELYAFWTEVPLLISHTSLATGFPGISVSAMPFAVTGIGALSSMLSGVASRYLSSEKVATCALVVSGHATRFCDRWEPDRTKSRQVGQLAVAADVFEDRPVRFPSRNSDSG